MSHRDAMREAQQHLQRDPFMEIFLRHVQQKKWQTLRMFLTPEQGRGYNDDELRGYARALDYILRLPFEPPLAAEFHEPEGEEYAGAPDNDPAADGG